MKICVISLKIMTKIKEENASAYFFLLYNVSNKPITLGKWKVDFMKHENKEQKFTLMEEENQGN